MDNSSLDRLLIENIADLDAGVKQLWSIERRLGEALDQLKKDWCDKAGWIAGDGTWMDKDDVSFGMAKWAEPEWLVWFQLGYAAGLVQVGDYGEESFWITRLCAEGVRQESGAQMGFRFAQGPFGAHRWKKTLRRNQEILAGTRFIFDDEPSFFLPCRVDRLALAEAVEKNDFRDALRPVEAAMDYIKEHAGKFDALLDELRASEAAEA
jgi:hypothetical protein